MTVTLVPGVAVWHSCRSTTSMTVRGRSPVGTSSGFSWVCGSDEEQRSTHQKHAYVTAKLLATVSWAVDPVFCGAAQVDW